MKRTARIAVVLAAVGVVLYGAYMRGWIRFNYPLRAAFPVRGIDVSHHQGRVDWTAVRDDEIAFAFIKASEGVDHRDREFDENWQRAGEAGIARGAYHFFTFCAPGGAQADNFITAVGGSFGELPPVADVEFSGNCRQWNTLDGIRVQLSEFLARVEAAARRRPILYFTADAHARIIAGHFAGFPTWPRNIFYQPSLGDEAWLFWQYADNGRVPGVRGLVDLNVFRGGPAEFAVVKSPPASGG